jgi:hypothetical protein
MKNMMILVVFIFLGGALFCQTHTIRLNEYWDLDATIITREQWHRLLEQNKYQNQYAMIGFTDELQAISAPFVNGQRFNLQGYYYLTGRLQPRNQEAKNRASNEGLGIRLTYGNTETGFMEIQFYGRNPYYANVFLINSDEFNRRYNQYIRWVNGE